MTHGACCRLILATSPCRSTTCLEGIHPCCPSWVLTSTVPCHAVCHAWASKAAIRSNRICSRPPLFRAAWDGRGWQHQESQLESTLHCTTEITCSPIFFIKKSCAFQPEDGTLSSSALPSPCCKDQEADTAFSRTPTPAHYFRVSNKHLGLPTPRRVAHLVSWRLRKTLVQAPERASCRSPDV